MKKNILTIIMAAMLLVSAVGCGTSTSHAPAGAPSTPSAPVGSSVPSDSRADAGEPVEDVTGTAEDAAEEETPVSEHNGADDAEEVTGTAEDTAEEETPVSEHDGADGAYPVEGDSKNDDKEPAAQNDAIDAYPATEDTRTEDEKLADRILAACSTQATAETDYKACIIDVRTARNPYDVDWDYGFDFNALLSTTSPLWDYVFDVEYYKSAFPMLALQYRYNDTFLTWHFATVGIHEGRQGCADFNVAAYMEACPEWIREKFGDNYASYYMYFMLSKEADRSGDLSGDGKPKQMTAVLTVVQAEELRSINRNREQINVEPLVFDSELAAIANYRAWTNADQDYIGHEWAIANNDAMWDMVNAIGGDTLSENTCCRFNANPKNWYWSYYASDAHREAMENPDYRFTGHSNVYAGDNNREEYSHKKTDTRWIQFDVFMGSLDTALNPRQ